VLQKIAIQETKRNLEVQPPRVWLVLGDKKGDNGQVFTIQDALDWHCEVKQVHMLEPFIVGKPKVAPTLYHINRERSDPLEPPWPDLVITVGRRPANVALWIREQSGGRTKIVMLGKPSGMIERFALIIVSTEILLPPFDNVLRISLPLMRVNETGIVQAVDAWKPRLANLPKPLVGIMVGGPTNPYIYNRVVTERLLAAAHKVCQEGGTPYITTSRRTPPSIVQQLRQELPAAAQLFEWTAHAEENPYLGLLGLCDRFVVTGDSISMMVEITQLGKPLAILPLPCGFVGSIDQWRRSLARWLYISENGASQKGWRQLLIRLVYHSYFIRHTRDYLVFHQLLLQRGMVESSSNGTPDDVAEVVKRIKMLMV